MFINDKTLVKATRFDDVPEGQTFKREMWDNNVFLKIGSIQAKPYWKDEMGEYSAICLQTCELVEFESFCTVYWVKTRLTVDVLRYDEN